jgi:predicted Zn-dependent protease
MRLILRSATAINLVVWLIPSSCTNAAPADRCQNARAHEKSMGTEITDARVTNALTAVVETSGFRHPVVVCEISMPYLNATVGRLGRHYYVGLTKMVLEEFTDAAVLGHEMAHLVLVDKGAMRSVLQKLRVNASILPDAALRNRATIEIDARIKALQ